MKKVNFYTEIKFYKNIDRIFVASCPRHLYFKERIRSRFTNMACTCTQFTKGRFNNCKLIFLILISWLIKSKLKDIDIPSTVEIKPIEQYLMMDTKSVQFFYFCRGCFKVRCSLDNPDSISLIKKNLLVLT